MDKTYLKGLKGVAWGSTENSHFDVDDWALYDWSMLLTEFPKVEELAQMASKAGVDGREAFFAMSGYGVKQDGSPISKAWDTILDSPAWTKAKASAQSRADKAALLTKLLQQMGRRALDKPEDELEALDDFESLEDLSNLDLPMADDIPTESEIENADAMMLLVRIISDGIGKEGKDPQDLLDEAFSLADRIDLSTFKDLLGFANKAVRGASRRAETARGDLVGYGTDSWSDKVIPTDMLAVARGDLEAMVRLSEGQLRTKKFEGEETMGKGPVVLLRDETTSMLSGKTFAPALSLEIVLADAFNKDGRDLVTIAWGGKGHTGESVTRKYTWGEDGLERHLRSNLRATSTYLYGALLEALETAEEYVDGADILIVSDGKLADSDKLAENPALKRKLDHFKDINGRIWVIILGNLEETSWREAIPVADGIISLDNLNAGEGLEKMISSMADRSSPSSMHKRMVW